MSDKNLESALSYYNALNNKDISAMAAYLHPEVHLIGPMGETTGKEAALIPLKHLLSVCHTVTVRAQFSSDTQVMLAYDITLPSPIEKSRAAVLLTFLNGLIIRYELFFDARPFTPVES